MGKGGWIGFDLDATLAQYEDFIAANVIGEPIPEMIAVLRRHLESGTECRIFTARIHPVMVITPGQDLIGLYGAHKEAVQAAAAIWKWLSDQGLPLLVITCCKDYSCWKLYDDRAVQVEKNTGVILGRDF